MSSGSEGQHQDLNPVFLAHYPLSNTLEKTHRTGPLTALGQVGSPQTQDFLRLHSDATAATSGSFRSESWGPAAPSLRLSVGVGGDQTRAQLRQSNTKWASPPEPTQGRHLQGNKGPS